MVIEYKDRYGNPTTLHRLVYERGAEISRLRAALETAERERDAHWSLLGYIASGDFGRAREVDTADALALELRQDGIGDRSKGADDGE